VSAVADSSKKGFTSPSYQPVQSLKKAPCQDSCPNCGDIRGWIGIVAQREKTGLAREDAYAQAWRTITEVNPFPATLGRICPHPCESHCNRDELDESLAINAMERFLGDFAIEAGLPLPRLRSNEAVESIGVVGAGPSGLSFAYQMSRRGYCVTIYDAREKPGGMLRYGVPDYRLPPAVLDAEIRRIVDLGVNLKMNSAIGQDISLDDLHQRHDYLYLGIGAQKGKALDIPGADGPSVLTSAEYLQQVNRDGPVSPGDHVVVIGGGSSAIDSARCARRGGASVVVMYRRGMEEMPALMHELEEAVEEGVELMLLVSPVRFDREADGRLISVTARHMKKGEIDTSGRPRPLEVEGSDFQVAADTVISAVSQVPDLEGFRSVDGSGRWLVGDEHGRISDRLWVGGDVLGLGIAGTAIVQGRHAAEQLHARLRNLEEETGNDETPPISNRDVILEVREHQDAVRPARRTAAERLGQPGLEASETITEEQFLQEAGRCMSCGACAGCEQCYMYCTTGCFTRVDESEPGRYFALALDECRKCGKCVEVCPSGYLDAT
jgi:NADPH-dependent glutamate synthase beta subunit-like oxidoreductase/Pyruvate/2-oxoacid:ferredoxin oxidoreductase delta subunit